MSYNQVVLNHSALGSLPVKCVSEVSDVGITSGVNRFQDTMTRPMPTDLHVATRPKIHDEITVLK